jgi:hypothetical protein
MLELRVQGHVANPFVCGACEVSFASSMALESVSHSIVFLRLPRRISDSLVL